MALQHSDNDDQISKLGAVVLWKSLVYWLEITCICSFFPPIQAKTLHSSCMSIVLFCCLFVFKVRVGSTNFDWNMYLASRISSSFGGSVLLSFMFTFQELSQSILEVLSYLAQISLPLGMSNLRGNFKALFAVMACLNSHNTIWHSENVQNDKNCAHNFPLALVLDYKLTNSTNSKDMDVFCFLNLSNCSFICIDAQRTENIFMYFPFSTFPNFSLFALMHRGKTNIFM